MSAVLPASHGGALPSAFLQVTHVPSLLAWKLTVFWLQAGLIILKPLHTKIKSCIDFKISICTNIYFVKASSSVWAELELPHCLNNCTLSENLWVLWACRATCRGVLGPDAETTKSLLCAADDAIISHINASYVESLSKNCDVITHFTPKPHKPLHQLHNFAFQHFLIFTLFLIILILLCCQLKSFNWLRKKCFSIPKIQRWCC